MTAKHGADATHLRVDTIRGDGVITFVLTGELDLASVDALEARVRACRTIPAERIVFDLRPLNFMDSAGLRLMLTLRNDAMRRRQEVSLVPGQQPVQRLFEVTRKQVIFNWTRARELGTLDSPLATV
jgi:anti-sigma B factor antagonist